MNFLGYEHVKGLLHFYIIQPADAFQFRHNQRFSKDFW